MNYLTFLNDLLPRIQALLPAGETAQYRKIYKNNGVEYTAVCLSCCENGQTSPVVYMEPFYEAVKNGTEADKIAETAAMILMNGTPEGIDSRMVTDREFALSHAVFRLVGREQNRALADEVVSRDFLDLLLTYGIYLPDTHQGGGITVVRKDMAAKWGVTEEELYGLAMENSKKLMGDKLENMNELIRREPDAPEDHMHILSNRCSFYGASALLYSDKPAQLSDRLGSDLYILPSSIHEVILIPAGQNEVGFLRNLVAGVNRTELHRENILSDQVYLYSRSEHRIQIAEAE